MSYSNPGDPGIGGYPETPVVPPTLESLSSQLHAHERRSQERYEELCDKLTSKESNMGMDNISDKVNINVGGEGSGGGGGMAAIIAALGNRNQGGDNAALIASMLGNRNDNDGGMNSMWPILLLALLGRGGGLLGGGADAAATAAGLSPGHAALLQTLLEGQSALRAEVPTTALETQAAIQQQISALGLGTQQGFANVKDAVQATTAVQLAATSGVKDAVQTLGTFLARDLCDVKSTVMSQGCETRELVQATSTAILSRIDRQEIDTLRHERDRFERSVEVNALRSQVEVNQTVNTTQLQAQAQQQQQLQFQDIGNVLRRLNDRIDIVHQEQRSTNANIIAGNTGAVVTGPQTSTPTNVNAR